mmetsp:Transcript_36407/g.85418  ORF Transcript_36407/g.85418 Transcript_36407/m.85418 type:complete len:205 (-) Transcript_36407:2044-2658(-)
MPPEALPVPCSGGSVLRASCAPCVTGRGITVGGKPLPPCDPSCPRPTSSAAPGRGGGVWIGGKASRPNNPGPRFALLRSSVTGARAAAGGRAFSLTRFCFVGEPAAQLAACGEYTGKASAGRGFKDSARRFFPEPLCSPFPSPSCPNLPPATFTPPTIAFSRDALSRELSNETELSGVTEPIPRMWRAMDARAAVSPFHIVCKP